MNGHLIDRRRGVVATNKNLYILFLQIYFICLPLNAVALGSMGSVLKYIAILPVGIAFLSLRSFRFNKLIVAQMAFVLFAGLSWLWSVNRSMSMSRTVSYVLLSALMFSGVVYQFNDRDIAKIKKAFLWSARTTALVMLLFSEFERDRFMLGGRLTEDPNYLCGYLIAGILLVIQQLQTKVKPFYVVELILYAFLILQTGSRGGLLAVSAAVIVYLLFYRKGTLLGNLKKLFYIGLLVLAVVVLISFLPDALKARFDFKDAIESGGTGRFEIWEEGMELYRSGSLFEKMFGIGTGTITEVLILTMNGETQGWAMHNIFLETLVELGVVGCIVYIMSILSFTISSFKEKDKFAFAVIVGMIVLSLSTSLHTFKPYFNIMFFILLISIYRKRDADSQIQIQER